MVAKISVQRKVLDGEGKKNAQTRQKTPTQTARLRAACDIDLGWLIY